MLTPFLLSCRTAALAFSLTMSAAGQTARSCETKDDTAYTAAIRQATTETYFSTELVDHLPWNSCVPAPDTYLGHIIGAPDVLDHVAQINGYMRLLASRSPRSFSIGACFARTETYPLGIYWVVLTLE